MLRLARSTRCLFSRNGLDIRSYTTDEFLARIKSGNLEPLRSSFSLHMDENKYLNLNIPGLLAKTESDESLCVFINMAGVKKKDVKTSLGTRSNLLSIQAKKYVEGYSFINPKEVYHAYMGLPKNVDRNTSLIETEMQDDGMLKLTFPKVKDFKQVKKPNIFTRIINRLYFKFNLRFYASIPSVILTLARPFVIKVLCPFSFNSFTMYKKETAESLHICVTRGLQKMDFMTGRVCVSINMPELKIGDVNLYYKHGTLFIEGKRKTKGYKVHYVTGIRLPHCYARKLSLIKEEMLYGMYKATIPIVN